MRLDASSIKVDGDKGTIELSMMGQKEPGGIVKTANGWMIDGDEMAGQAPSMGDAAAEFPKLQNVLKQLQDGTISNQDQFNEAMSSISMQ